MTTYLHLIGDSMHLVSEELFWRQPNYALQGLFGFENGYNRAQSVHENSIPFTVTHIHMCPLFKHPIFLPGNLIVLLTGVKYSGSLHKLPETLQCLIVGAACEDSLKTVPPNIRYLDFDGIGVFNKPLYQLPNTLRVLKLDNLEFNQPLDIQEGLEELYLGTYMQPLQLPSTLRVFKCRFLANAVVLNNTLMVLKVIACAQNIMQFTSLWNLKFGRWLWFRQEFDHEETTSEHMYIWYSSMHVSRLRS